MKEKYRFCLRLLLWTCLYMMTVPISAGAEIPADRVTDLSGSASGYGREIARINRELSGNRLFAASAAKTGGAVRQVLVLCRTTGELPADCEWERGIDGIIAGPRNCYAILTEGADRAAELVNELNVLPTVLYCEPDSLIFSADAPETPEFDSYGAAGIGLDRFLPYCSARQTGSVTVAVIDSGVYPHELIRSKVLRNGFDYVDMDTDPTNDPYGHGTAVAGIIADCTRGVSVYIYPIRVLNASGSGNVSNVCNAIFEAVDAGAEIINLSLARKEHSAALDDAVLFARSNGVTVVISAGNYGCDAAEVCPAHLTEEGVIVVGSASGSGSGVSVESYSDYGKSVDVYCCGTGISVCAPGGGTASMTGTSVSAPHISALAAMMKLIRPALSPASVENWVREISGSGAVKVPDAAALVPTDTGYRMSRIILRVGEPLRLPAGMLPATCHVKIGWSSSDPDVLRVEDGTVFPAAPGNAILTAECSEFGTEQITVIVTEAVPEQKTVLPASLLKLGEEAFYEDTGLTKVELPDGMTCIGARAFYGCFSLNTVVIPSSVEAIGEDAFPAGDDILLLFESGIPPEGGDRYQYVITR